MCLAFRFGKLLIFLNYFCVLFWKIRISVLTLHRFRGKKNL